MGGSREVRVPLPAAWAGTAADHERLRVLAARKGGVVLEVDNARQVATLVPAKASNRQTA